MVWARWIGLGCNGVGWVELGLWVGWIGYGRVGWVGLWNGSAWVWVVSSSMPRWPDGLAYPAHACWLMLDRAGPRLIGTYASFVLSQRMYRLMQTCGLTAYVLADARRANIDWYASFALSLRIG